MTLALEPTTPPLAQLTTLLTDPCPVNWLAAARILDKLHKDRAPDLSPAITTVRKCIQKWHPDARKCVPRPPLEHWRRASCATDVGQVQSHDALLDLCLLVRETHTYSYFETWIANDPALLWQTDGVWGRKGSQQVHIVRAFSGSARAVKTDSWLKIGEPGQGDLAGWFSLWLPPYGVVAVKLEVEIKTPTGRLSTKQRDRRTELARAGGIYLCVKSVKSAVMQLVKVREVLGEGRTMPEAVLAVEGLGW